MDSRNPPADSTRPDSFGNQRFFPPLVAIDESHVHADADFAGLRGLPKTPEFARDYFNHFVTSTAARHADAEFAKREAMARDWLTDKVFDAMCDVPFVDYGDPDIQGMAAAAIDVFMGFLRNPPTMVEHPDGHIEIRPTEGAR